MKLFIKRTLLYISRTTALKRCSGLYLLVKDVIFFKTERHLKIFLSFCVRFILLMHKLILSCRQTSMDVW